jgi:hypothetical protein
MMSREDYEIFDYLKQERQQEGEKNRRRAGHQFKEASTYAAQYGFQLIRHSETHYKVKTRMRCFEVYPGNQRIYQHPNKRGPYIKLPLDWTLLDVVQAVAQELQGEDD